MEFMRQRWKLMLLMIGLAAMIVGVGLFLWKGTREKNYVGGLLVQNKVLHLADSEMLG